MDLIEVIQTIEKDHPAAAQALNDFQAIFTQNMAKVNSLESDLQKAAEKRDQLKTTIRNATGLDEITEEGLKSILSKDSTEQSVILKKEIQTLQNKLNENEAVVDGIRTKYEQQIFDLRLDRAANMLGVSSEVHNQHAFNVILNELGKGATFDGENLVYKNADGTTRFTKGGQTATIQSVYEELKANEDFAYMFKEQFKAGGGKRALGPTSDPSGHSLRRSKMTTEEKTAYIGKHSIDAYKQLPL